MGRNALHAFGQEITGRRITDIAQYKAASCRIASPKPGRSSSGQGLEIHDGLIVTSPPGLTPEISRLEIALRESECPRRHQPKLEIVMAESVYKVIELVGTSTESWEKAAKAAVDRAAKTLRDLRVAEVVEQDLQLNNGKVEAYRAKVKLSFKYEGGG
jgi:flavin-binding protein dodecin